MKGTGGKAPEALGKYVEFLGKLRIDSAQESRQMHQQLQKIKSQVSYLWHRTCKKLGKDAWSGVRTHAAWRPVDLKSTPLTTRASKQYPCF